MIKIAKIVEPVHTPKRQRICWKQWGYLCFLAKTCKSKNGFTKHFTINCAEAIAIYILLQEGWSVTDKSILSHDWFSRFSPVLLLALTIRIQPIVARYL